MILHSTPKTILATLRGVCGTRSSLDAMITPVEFLFPIVPLLHYSLPKVGTQRTIAERALLSGGAKVALALEEKQRKKKFPPYMWEAKVEKPELEGKKRMNNLLAFLRERNRTETNEPAEWQGLCA